MSSIAPRKGLAVKTTSNLNRMARQIGKSNLHDQKCGPDAQVPRTRMGAVNTRSTAVPIPKSTFTVYEDPVEDYPAEDNNVIHRLLLECKKENDSQIVAKRECKKSSGLVARKPLTALQPSIKRDDSDLDDDVFTLAPSVAESHTMRSEMSNLGMDDDDSQSAFHSAVGNYESEYGTANEGRRQDEDILFSALEFSEDIYNYMRDREIKVRPKPNYMAKQKDINSEMRTILVDWLSDVVSEYDMQQETLHLAVSLVDRTLSRCRIDRLRLQLVGATAMMIASKYEEIYPPDLKTFVYLTDDTYAANQIIKMERVILDEVNYDVSTATVQWFGSRFARQQRASKATEHALQYLMDLSLLNMDLLNCRPSYIAAACLCYANILTDYEPWSTEMESLTGIQYETLAKLIPVLHKAFAEAPFSSQSSIYSRFNCPEKSDVASIPPPQMLPL